MFESLRGAKVFTQLDLVKAFHQIPIVHESQEYLAFTTTSGKYTYTSLPLGIKVASQIFQEKMANVFQNLLRRSPEEGGVLVYMDDILLYAANVETMFIVNHHAIQEKRRSRGSQYTGELLSFHPKPC